MEWLKGIQVLAIICAQWGDSGKGKLVDYFSAWADIIVRGTGGANAGHTIWIGLKQFIFHLIPCGILYPDKINIMGSGMAIDPEVLIEELDILTKEGIAYQNLLVSLKAKLILPPHRVLDVIREKFKGRVGSTGKGMSPVHEGHVGRKGCVINDLLLDPKSFQDKLERSFAETIMLLKAYRQESIKNGGCDIVHEVVTELGYESFWHNTDIFDFKKISEHYISLGDKIASMIVDTDQMILEALKDGKKILLEGAQGTLLSVDYGTYPYVTSSDSTIHGLAKGAGLSVGDVDHTILVVKAPYMTRVGDGPFPTEMGGTQSEEWCRESTQNDESILFGDLTFGKITSEFELGVCIRKKGGETGATTGRLRRIGWLDLVAVRYAMRINRTNFVALTKLDVLCGYPTIKVCVAYRYEGPDFRYGKQTYIAGDEITNFIPIAEFLKYCQPIYKEFDGYGDMSQMKSREAMCADKSLDSYLKFLEEENFCIDIISTGPDRNQTIPC